MQKFRSELFHQHREQHQSLENHHYARQEHFAQQKQRQQRQHQNPVQSEHNCETVFLGSITNRQQHIKSSARTHGIQQMIRSNQSQGHFRQQPSASLTSCKNATSLLSSLHERVSIRKSKGANPRDIKASVTSPSGAVQRCDLVDLSDSHFGIRFVPSETGVHTVSVKHREAHVPGSPFQFTVGPLGDGGADKVRVLGQGLERGRTDRLNEFSIYTREAGAGGLSIAIEGPSKAEIDFEDRKDGSCLVGFRVTEPGQYSCSVKFNDEHVTGSPFQIQVDGEPSRAHHEVGVTQHHHIINDRPQLSIAAFQDREIKIGQQTGVTVNYASPNSSLTANVFPPGNAPAEPCHVIALPKNQFSIQFVPRQVGMHRIEVYLADGSALPGSPYHVNVQSGGTPGNGNSLHMMTGGAAEPTTGPPHGDAGLVRAGGPGLDTAYTGQKNQFWVDTGAAGSGSLSVTIDGPSKVQLECEEQPDAPSNYRFHYVPTRPGQYHVSVKYGAQDRHVAGSPFPVTVYGENMMESPPPTTSAADMVFQKMTSTTTTTGSNTSNASRVQCEGDGLQNAYIGRQNRFIVNAHSAGSDILYVGVSGPTRPCEEVNVRHVGNDNYQVSYSVEERGRHLLIVKWGDKHVPGSPFLVVVP